MGLLDSINGDEELLRKQSNMYTAALQGLSPQTGGNYMAPVPQGLGIPAIEQWKDAHGYGVDPSPVGTPVEDINGRSQIDFGYGLRPDGTHKGPGWKGLLKRPGPNGGVSTEIAMGVGIDGKETLIPLIVPTLSKEEQRLVLTTPMESMARTVPESLMMKAAAHAKMRMRAGQSPFKDN